MTHLTNRLTAAGRVHPRLRWPILALLALLYAPAALAEGAWTLWTRALLRAPRRGMAACLTVCLLLGLLPMGALAADDGEDAAQTSERGMTYSVSSAEGLAEIAAMTALGDCSGITIHLESDIEADGNTYLGTFAEGFKGIFDGRGHTVTLNNEDGGLFALIGEGGAVRNLVIAGDVSAPRDKVGGVADQCSKGTIQNCANTADVSSCAASGNRLISIAGGIVGEANGTAIKGCYNSGAVFGDEGNVGGIAGNAFSGTTVQSCYNTGAVYGDDKIGGIVGNNDQSSVIDCYNTGVVVGEDRVVGGIVGEHYGNATLTNCLSLGPKVAGTASTMGRVAGIVEYAPNSITNCAARTDLKLFINSEEIEAQDKGADTINGADLTLGESVVWSSWLTDSDVWEFASDTLSVGGALPTLKNAPGDQSPTLPEYTVDPNCSVTMDGVTTYYPTLQAAREAVEGSVIIRVERNYTNRDYFGIGTDYAGAADVTLDLNGKTLICPALGPGAGGSLTLTGGGTLRGNITQDGGVLTIDNARVMGSLTQTGGALTITGGTFGLLLVYDSAESTVLSGGTFQGGYLLGEMIGAAYTGVDLTEENARSGLANILAPGSAYSSNEVMAERVRFDDEGEITGYIAYLAGPVSVVTTAVDTGPATYRPIITPSENGTVKTSPTAPSRGQTVTITATPEEEWALDTVTVTDRKGNAVEVTPGADGRFIFKQPSGRVTITVTFRAPAPAPLFTDVEPSDWFYEGVDYICSLGLVEADPAGTFSPMDHATRAGAVSLLWTLEGRPAAEGGDFPDAPADAREALAWASENALLTGYAGGLSGADDAISREQLAVLLYRYVQFKGVETPTEGMAIGSFSDGGRVSSWARDAVRWCLAEGILNGRGGGVLDPQGPATRAETAVMLHRCLDNR